MAITFSLANCDLNYSLFGVFEVLAKFKQSDELSTLTNWFDWSAKAKVLNIKLCIQWGITQA